MEYKKTIVMVLKSGGDFTFNDVELLTRHIRGKWRGVEFPRIICLWDKASTAYNLGNIEILPLTTDQRGTWSRIALYSPEMEQYRPFLYIDLDTAVINSIEKIFDLVKDPSQFITLEDFWQKGKLATGLVWVPAKSQKVSAIYKQFLRARGSRMDNYIRSVTKADVYWQQLTQSIYDFKPSPRVWLSVLPVNADMVCFHGHPRIFEASHIGWVRDYIYYQAPVDAYNVNSRVTVIIPYKINRGWLQEAIDSVPEGVQLIISQGEGNWPENFNKVLSEAKGEFIRWLHEDDMLTENCIRDSVRTMETQEADFIHGNAIELMDRLERKHFYRPPIPYPTVSDMLRRNAFHQVTLMYRREVFEKVGKLDETLNTAEEFEFNLRCLAAGLRVGYCSTPLGIYRRHSTQKIKTTKIEDRRKESEKVKSKYRVELKL